MSTGVNRRGATGVQAGSAPASDRAQTRERLRSPAPEGLASSRQSFAAISGERLGFRVPEYGTRGQENPRERQHRDGGWPVIPSAGDEPRRARGSNCSVSPLRENVNMNFSSLPVREQLRVAVEALNETREGVEMILRAVQTKRAPNEVFDYLSEDLLKADRSPSSSNQGNNPGRSQVGPQSSRQEIRLERAQMDKNATPAVETETFSKEELEAELRKLKEQCKIIKAKIHAESKNAGSAPPVQIVQHRDGNGPRISITPMSRGVEQRSTRQARTPSEKAEALKPSNQFPRTSLLGQYFARQGSGGAAGDYLSSSSDDESSEDDLRGFTSPIRSVKGPDSIQIRNASSRGNSKATEAVYNTVYGQPKPTEPENYDGKEDIEHYLQFVQDFEQYCKEAGIPEEDQVIKCSHFLSGKAREFYTTMVSMNVHKWDLGMFLKDLFNWCFPPDFRLRQRRKLENFHQGDMLVSEYAHRLDMMYRIVGSSTKRERVDKLWNGLRDELQIALWREGLDFERSTWNEVIEVAMRHELAGRIIRNRGHDRHSDDEPSESESDKVDSDQSDQEMYQSGEDSHSEEYSGPEDDGPGENESRLLDFDHSDEEVYDSDGEKNFSLRVAAPTKRDLNSLAATTEGVNDMGAYFMQIDNFMCSIGYGDNPGNEFLTIETTPNGDQKH